MSKKASTKGSLNGKPKLTPFQGKKPLTPYQGNDQCFGWFLCTKCNKSWSSAYSWANTHQQCKRCLGNIYPYMQKKLERGQGKATKTPHPMDLCGKCKTLGFNCKMLPKHRT
ncbi:Zinc finger CCHC domain-containing protein 24 [Armadillidium vulgare]|nr:Zinc finger CCHC domain-containing protein 24 [Armadillidium vulgare]